MRRTAALVSLTLIAGLIGFGWPAYAEKHQAVDATGDVIQFDNDGGGNNSSMPAPDDTQADVMRSVVNHKRGRVLIRVHVRDLTTPTGGDIRELTAFIRSNKRWQTATLMKFGSNSPVVDIYGRRGNIKCRGIQKKMRAREDLLEMSIPRSCLGNPQWVRVGIGTFSGTTQGAFVDDAHRIGGAFDHPLRLTPKLRRG